MTTKANLVKFNSAEEKAHFVRNMFDRISPKYDLMNRIMTFGQDVRWRRLAIDLAALPENGALLDIACGTGDLAIEAMRCKPTLVVAADFSLNMIRLGRQKANPHKAIRFIAADGLQMPFRDDVFDAVVTGFSMRNVVDVDRFIREMARVVRPGGKVVILEITPLKSSLMKRGFHLYFQKIVPFLGGIIAGDREAYTYLPQSVEVFIPADELKQRMEAARLRNVQYKKLNLGTVALHWGEV
ncbi:MAG: bifunctional demethylmenaquinone methyltransferase/2-methoxy-6-polyprenyl-1,4-benzoquinol methylase UbiE [candidate division KSB1 bacterium]|nr:bifunctional demethylmenaquinone methyltransferase/2-methoxy-6-polyprenyl-1,4-benzoquinol methylase UbiE [candidate division KSB1 bacterium]MDQ7062740.1 bifunctional demethylmenaquinone methyltransferase/2-methoxy-6-polyprenyl-1,4-benzoquinol methylase UbiE [candidate division KSB1 bacterium]